MANLDRQKFYKLHYAKVLYINCTTVVVGSFIVNNLTITQQNINYFYIKKTFATDLQYYIILTILVTVRGKCSFYNTRLRKICNDIKY